MMDSVTCGFVLISLIHQVLSVPSAPQNFVFTGKTQTSLSFSWSPPQDVSTGITKYLLECSRKNGKEILFSETTSTTATVANLATFTTYNCTVAAYSNVIGLKSDVIQQNTNDGEFNPCLQPLGLENYLIPENRLSSSKLQVGSSLNDIRLNSEKYWCSDATSNHVFQIDFGQLVTFTGIAIQGEKAIETIHFKYRNNQDQKYREVNKDTIAKDGIDRKRDFNYPRSKYTSRSWFASESFTARYIEVHFGTFLPAGIYCMRLEFYGCPETCASKLLKHPKTYQGHSNNIVNYPAIQSSSFWSQTKDDEFLRFDFGHKVFLKSVVIQRSSKSLLQKFSMKCIASDETLNFTARIDGHNETFSFLLLNSSIICQVVQLSTSPSMMNSFRISFAGCQSECAHKMGIESRMPDVSLTASGYYAPKNDPSSVLTAPDKGFLNNMEFAWVSNSVEPQWFQACFKKNVYEISGIALQGQGNAWWFGRIYNYTVKYGYKDADREYKINDKVVTFKGTDSRFGTNVAEFPYPVYARCVQIKFDNSQCYPGCAARIELLGCRQGTPRQPTITPFSQGLNCFAKGVHAQINWILDNSTSYSFDSTTTNPNVDSFINSTLTFNQTAVPVIYHPTFGCIENEKLRGFLCLSTATCELQYDDIVKTNTSKNFTVLYIEKAPKVSRLNSAVNKNSVNITWDIEKKRRLLSYTFNVTITEVGKNISTIHSIANQHWFSITLKFYTKYTVKVLSFNKYNVSNEDMISVDTQEGAPDAPQNLTISSRTSTSISFSWLPPNQHNGILSHYKLKCCRKNCREIYIVDNIDVKTRQARVDNLATYTEYNCSVQAFTSGGTIEGIWSSAILPFTEFQDACHQALGIETDLIPSTHITSKCGDTENARLNSENGWCCATANESPLLIDLGQIMTITGMAFQGGSNYIHQISFRFGVEKAGVLKKLYTDEIGAKERFYDYPQSTTTLRKWFDKTEYFTARFVEFNFVGSPPVCFKVELYGCPESCTDVITTTNQPNHPDHTNKLSNLLRCLTGDETFLRYDFGQIRTLSGLILTKHTNVYDNFTLKCDQKSVDDNKIYLGDFSKDSAMTYWFTKQECRILDIIPTDKKITCLMPTFIGCKSGCIKKLGILPGSMTGPIGFDQNTQSENGFLNNMAAAYLPKSRRINEGIPWIQTCSTDLQTVTAIAIQGQGSYFNNARVLEFILFYNYGEGDRILLRYAVNQTLLVFDGPYNRYSTKIAKLPHPLVASCIRLKPTKCSSQGCAVRWDLLGCYNDMHPIIHPIPPVEIKKNDLRNISCLITSQPRATIQWNADSSNSTKSFNKYHQISTSGNSMLVNGNYTSTIQPFENVTELIAYSDVPCKVDTDNMADCYVTYTCVAFYKESNKGSRNVVATFKNLNATVIPASNFTIDSTNTSATLLWQNPTNSDFPTLYYKVHINDTRSGFIVHTNGSIDVKESLDTLKPFTLYEVNVVGFNRLNVSSKPLTKIFTTKEGVPSITRNLTLTAKSSDEIQATWLPPNPINGIITKYELQYKQNLSNQYNVTYEIITITKGLMIYSVSKLQNYQLYQFRVRAFTKNNELDGPWTDWVQERTMEGVPTPPRDVKCSSITSKSITVTWLTPALINGVLQSYTVRLNGIKSYNRSFTDSREDRTFSQMLTFNNLYPGTNYSFVIYAKTGGGTSDPSKIKYNFTEYGAPILPIISQRTTVMKETTLRFNVVPDYTGPISFYEIGVTTAIYSQCPDTFNTLSETIPIDVHTIKHYVPIVITKGVDTVGLANKNISVELIGTYFFYWRAVIQDGEKYYRGKCANKTIERRDLEVFHEEDIRVYLTFLTIILKEGPASTKFYQIIVVEGEVTDIDPNPTDLQSYDQTVDKTKPYITAEINAEEFLKYKLFDVGNGETFTRNSLRYKRSIEDTSEIFTNQRLVRGKKYSVLQRAYTSQTDYYSSPWFVVKMNGKEPTSVPKGEDKGLNMGLVGGVVVSIVVILVIVAVIAIFIIKKRRNRNQPSKKNALESKTASRLVDIGQVNPSADLDEQNSESMLDRVPPKGVGFNARHPPIAVSTYPKHWEYLKKDSHYALTEEYKSLDSGQLFRWDDATQAINKPKNRYANIVAYDHSRVHLLTKTLEENDYINASYVHGYHKKNKYIASQGPNTTSLDDFWRMIWEQEVEVIVMATNLIERSKKKCEQYWPSTGTQQFGDLEITLTLVDTYSDFVVRTLMVKKHNSKERREVIQFHYLSWPDHGVPAFPSDVINLRHKIRKMFPVAQAQSPILVHCSAGVGRTGTFLCIDEMLDLAKLENKVDVFNYVNYLRSRRIHMVQTEDQYLFIYRALYEAFTCGITEISSQDIRSEIHKLLKPNQDGTKKNGFQLQYDRLNTLSPPLDSNDITSSTKDENKNKNRYEYILPRDNARVVLSKSVYDDEEGDYINAVFVDGYKQKDAFIATQYPLPNTVNDFWHMIFQNKIGTIVLLNNLYEEDQDYDQFWPSLDNTIDVENFSITMLKENNDKINKMDFQIKNNTDNSSFQCSILHYLLWENFEAPKEASDIVDLLNIVEKQRFLSGGDRPVVVVCSDGAARSGTFIAISILMEYLKIDQLIDVFQTVKKIRTVRPQFVGNEKQYKYCYDVVLAYLDSFSTYSNYGDM